VACSVRAATFRGTFTKSAKSLRFVAKSAKSLQNPLNRCVSLQNPPKSAKSLRFVAKSAKIRQNPPNRCKSLRLGVTLGLLSADLGNFGELCLQFIFKDLLIPYYIFK
jgi:hypothetical protein